MRGVTWCWWCWWGAGAGRAVAVLVLVMVSAVLLLVIDVPTFVGVPEAIKPAGGRTGNTQVF